jgi:hypothetical protein
VRALAIDDDHVGSLADFYRSYLVLDAKRACAGPCRHPQDVARPQHPRLMPDRLQPRSQPHLLEHVEPVVAGRAVGAQRHRDPLFPHLDDRRDTGPQLEIGAGTMHHFDVVLGEHLLLRVVGPHAMRDTQTRRGETNISEILQIVQPARKFANDRNLLT